MRQTAEGWYDLKGRPIPADQVVNMARDGGPNMASLVERVNKHLNKVFVQLTKDGRGYGLFAKRKLQRGEEITEYGGLYFGKCSGAVEPHEDPAFKGYMFDIEKRDCVYTYDAGRYFRVGDGGRWINEPPHGEEWLVNVEGRSAGKRFYFVAKKPVEAGRELFLLYGPEYENPWWRWRNLIQNGTRQQLENLLRDFDADSTPLTPQESVEKAAARNQIVAALNNGWRAYMWPQNDGTIRLLYEPGKYQLE